MRFASILLATGAIVPVRAIKALMANAINVLKWSAYYHTDSAGIERTLSQPSQIAQ